MSSCNLFRSEQKWLHTVIVTFLIYRHYRAELLAMLTVNNGHIIQWFRLF